MKHRRITWIHLVLVIMISIVALNSKPRTIYGQKTIRNTDRKDHKLDLATSSVAQSAQLTLISILLGTILGILFGNIHFENSSSVKNILAATTFLAAINLWIQYTWGIITFRWPLSVEHSLIYFLVAGSEIGLALNVSNFGVWIWWAVFSCFAAFIAYMFNIPFLAESPIYRFETFIDKKAKDRHLLTLKASLVVMSVAIITFGVVMLIGALEYSGALRAFSIERGKIPIIWGLLGLFFMIIDLFMQRTYMIRQRFEGLEEEYIEE